MLSNQVKNQHLMWRAGFGPAAGQLEQLATLSPAHLYKALKKASSNPPGMMDVADEYLKGLLSAAGQGDALQKLKELDKDQRKMIQQKQREDIKNLNLTWMREMVNSDAQLREKMAFFWHGHFASRNINIFFQQGLLDVIRKNALGSFRDLLHEVSKSAAMLNFLNANQNRKDHPNENFAREVMELFTMGRGHYTETDIKEAARAFTGWGANFKGEFVFRKPQHDTGVKTVLGKTGNFDGDDVLDILLDQPQTANYITQKIYRFFVNENVDTEKTEWLSHRFYQSNYSISGLMDDIFTSHWFYDPQHIGTRIKSPVELIVGIRRMLPMQVENEAAFLIAQRLLGQVLFYPPNVAGWPGGKSWIDSSTLMMRMRLPQMINDQDEMNVLPKTDDDTMMGRAEDAKELNTPTFTRNKGIMKGGQMIRATIDWKSYLNYYEQVPRAQLVPSLTSTLLQVPPSFQPDLITSYADNSSRETFVKTATIQVMSTPEYQMN
jgi:uncharacterized protein (DUF1800 family)